MSLSQHNLIVFPLHRVRRQPEAPELPPEPSPVPPEGEGLAELLEAQARALLGLSEPAGLPDRLPAQMVVMGDGRDAIACGGLVVFVAADEDELSVMPTPYGTAHGVTCNDFDDLRADLGL